MEHMSYAKGISWFDDCRIPFVDGDKTVNHNTVPGSFVGSVGYSEKVYHENTTGRFPANIVVSDDMLNDGGISKSVKGRNDIGSSTYGGNSLLNSKTKMNNTDRGFNDKGTNSRYYDIDKWFENLLESCE
jgi:hypothetical protein